MFAHGTRATQHRNNLASQAAAPHVPGNVGKQAILTELETGMGAFFSVITKLGSCCGCLFVMLAIVGTASAGSGPFRTTPNPDKVAHTRLQSGLIVVESALVVVLLAGAGLFIRSYINVESVDTGFSSSTLTMNISLDARCSKVQQRIAFFQNLFAKLHVLPGVRAAAVIDNLPLSNSEGLSQFEVDGYPNEIGQLAESRWITPQYFAAGKEELR